MNNEFLQETLQYYRLKILLLCLGYHVTLTVCLTAVSDGNSLIIKGNIMQGTNKIPQNKGGVENPMPIYHVKSVSAHNHQLMAHYSVGLI